MFSFCPALNKAFYGSLDESSSPIQWLYPPNWGESSSPIQWLYPPNW